MRLFVSLLLRDYKNYHGLVILAFLTDLIQDEDKRDYFLMFWQKIVNGNEKKMD